MDLVKVPPLTEEEVALAYQAACWELGKGAVHAAPPRLAQLCGSPSAAS